MSRWEKYVRPGKLKCFYMFFLHKHISQPHRGIMSPGVAPETIPKTGFWQAQPSASSPSHDYARAMNQRSRNENEAFKEIGTNIIQIQLGFPLTLHIETINEQRLTTFFCCWMKKQIGQLESMNQFRAFCLMTFPNDQELFKTLKN